MARTRRVMRDEHKEQLRDALSKTLNGRRYIEIDLHYNSKGIGNTPSMRARWDTLWSIEPALRNPIVTELYKYLDDVHIDIALREILATL
ncbi:hypothetical protein [Aeromonas veronii]|uniref:hypothetical protein n=1 Tax=Aeromonas veronii TaxID=654 RepID=UPI003B9EF1DD